MFLIRFFTPLEACLHPIGNIVSNGVYTINWLTSDKYLIKLLYFPLAKNFQRGSCDNDIFYSNIKKLLSQFLAFLW